MYKVVVVNERVQNLSGALRGSVCAEEDILLTINTVLNAHEYSFSSANRGPLRQTK